MKKTLLIVLSIMACTPLLAQQKPAGYQTTGGATTPAGVGRQTGSQGGIGYETGSRGGIGYEVRNNSKSSNCDNAVCTEDMCKDGKPRSAYQGDCCSCDPNRFNK